MAMNLVACTDLLMCSVRGMSMNGLFVEEQ